MLLLILFAGCLATYVAQNITVLGTTSAAYTPDYVAIFQAYVQYAGQFDLNEITAQPILNKINQLISQQLPGSNVTLKVRNITRV